jgi:hypothetical protein
VRPSLATAGSPTPSRTACLAHAAIVKTPQQHQHIGKLVTQSMNFILALHLLCPCVLCSFPLLVTVHPVLQELSGAPQPGYSGVPDPIPHSLPRSCCNIEDATTASA